MALDTTVGGPSADSYGSEAESLAYHTSRGNAAWGTAQAGDRETALRRAAAWLDGEYRMRWPGVKTNGRNQALDWPRVDATDVDGFEVSSSTIPNEIKSAQFEAALAELLSPGSLSPQVTMASVVKSESVGPLSTTYDTSLLTGVSALAPTLLSVERVLSSLVRRIDGPDDPAIFVV